MERQETKMGMNRTGVQMSPQDLKRMLDDVGQSTTAVEDGAGIAAMRTRYITEAEPVGTVPLPGTAKGVAKAAIKAPAGKSPTVLVDKLGERLAFERSGVRLYEALLTKYEATPEKLPEMPADRLRHFRDEEAQHFKWVAEALESLGADPTAQTPGADIAGVESAGLMQVIEDPRTTIPQSLHAVLVAELADLDGWTLLIKLAEDLGQDQMLANFRQALREEQDHLEHVRQWVEQGARAESR